MEIKNFDNIISRVPKLSAPLRVVLAGSDGENMLRGLFQAQTEGFVQPVLVGDRARTMVQLEKLGLEQEPYTMVDTPRVTMSPRPPSTSLPAERATSSCAATCPPATF